MELIVITRWGNDRAGHGEFQRISRNDHVRRLLHELGAIGASFGGKASSLGTLGAFKSEIVGINCAIGADLRDIIPSKEELVLITPGSSHVVVKSYVGGGHD
jgi:hypothetical protein